MRDSVWTGLMSSCYLIIFTPSVKQHTFYTIKYLVPSEVSPQCISQPYLWSVEGTKLSRSLHVFLSSTFQINSKFFESFLFEAWRAISLVVVSSAISCITTELLSPWFSSFRRCCFPGQSAKPQVLPMCFVTKILHYWKLTINPASSFTNVHAVWMNSSSLDQQVAVSQVW